MGKRSDFERREADFYLTPRRALIKHFQDIAPTWLLIDYDWSATKQAAEYLSHARTSTGTTCCRAGYACIRAVAATEVRDESDEGD